MRRLLRLFRYLKEFFMADIPSDLTAKLADAEDKLQAAQAADKVHADADAALSQAVAVEAADKDAALAAHQTANAAAQSALDALKAHFGLS